MIQPDDILPPTVVVIEDDVDVRVSLQGLFRSVGLDVAPYGSVQEYLADAASDRPGCMVLDVRLPGKSGLDFQDDLVKANAHASIVFISGHADVAMSVRAMKAGAVEFLAKPVRDQDLLDAVQSAIEKDAKRRLQEASAAASIHAFSTLTPRERVVMACVVTGRPNKQIAAELGLSEATVKLHRGNVMHKMGARSLVDLVRMNDLLRDRPA